MISYIYENTDNLRHILLFTIGFSPFMLNLFVIISLVFSCKLILQLNGLHSAFELRLQTKQYLFYRV